MAPYPYTRFFIHFFGILLFCLTLNTNAEDKTIDAKAILESLDVSKGDIKKIENGEVVTFSGEPYEQSKRELASDATVIINKSLDAVLAEINEQASLIPRDVTEGYGDIESEADFAAIGFNPDSDREFKEVERLYNELEKGDDYNLTAAEFESFKKALEPGRNLPREEKMAVASEAVCQLLIGRYNAYRKNGLKGIEPYLRGKKEVNIGNELRITTETLDVVEDYLPDYYSNLLNYPAGSECCQQRFRWLKVRILKRPAFGLTHSTVHRTDEILIVTERHFYVTHTLNSLQLTVAWIPYAEGTYMGLAMSAQADALDTFLGKMFRKLGRSKAEEMVGDVLVDIRDQLEGNELGADAQEMDFIKQPEAQRAN